MTTFSNLFKAEVARIARKELRDELAALRKISTVQRSEIAGLKKTLKAMQSQLTKIARGQLAIQTSPAKAAGPAETAPPKGRPGRKVVFSADRLKNERARLGFTQEQMAKYLGVSTLSIWKWESGGAAPREKRVPEIMSRISMGKREALSLLESL
jgi:DNA-binding XRE family transcriptional regulator